MPVAASRLTTTALRNRVVREFNAGKTQRQIAEEQGLTVGAVGRLLFEARRLKIPVVSYTASDRTSRANRSRYASLRAAAETATDN